MATSGTSVISVTRDDIILAAFEDMGVYAPGAETPTAGEMEMASRRLNMMIKAWQAAGVGLWLHQTAVLPLQAGAQSYLLGPTGSHCSPNMDETELAEAAAAGSSAITVRGASGIQSGWAIGVELENNSLQWTTVSGVSGDGVVELAQPLQAGARAGAVVFCYGKRVERPLSIVEARIRSKDGVETALSPISYNEYMALPLKGATGRTTQYCYHPLTGNGVLYVWPVNAVVSDRIVFTARVPVQVFVNLDDAPDFPQEWFDALHFGLALRLCPAFQVPAEIYARLREMAAVTLQDANGMDREQDASVFFGVSAW